MVHAGRGFTDRFRQAHDTPRITMLLQELHLAALEAQPVLENLESSCWNVHTVISQPHTSHGLAMKSITLDI